MPKSKFVDGLPHQSEKGKGMSFWKAAKSLPEKKAALSMVEVKKLTKLMEALGKPVTAITSHGNGTFTVKTADMTAFDDYQNPFDEVLT